MSGALITADMQLELRTTLMGWGTDYHLDLAGGGVGGLFDMPVKFSEVDYAHADGGFAGDAFKAVRTVTVALLVVKSTTAAVHTAIDALHATWAPASSDLELWFQWPGWGKRHVVGRPLGLTVDSSEPLRKDVPVLASFRVTDPTIH